MRSMVKQAKVTITGDVIGVGFRAWILMLARKLGVTGWVRNTKKNGDEYVKALLQGEEKILHQMFDKIRQGSPLSGVTNVTIEWQTPDHSLTGFEILR